MTVDLSNLDNTTLNLVTGEAGNILSPNFMDQWQAWYSGTTFLFPFSGRATQHQLTLLPVAGKN